MDNVHTLHPPAKNIDAMSVFVANAYVVAEGSDRVLANLLRSVLAERCASDRALLMTDWRGDRRAGLTLCRRLLEYVVRDYPDEQLELALHYIDVALEASGGAPAANDA